MQAASRGKKVKQMSFLHEIDDENVLHALRAIRRRAGRRAGKALEQLPEPKGPVPELRPITIKASPKPPRGKSTAKPHFEDRNATFDEPAQDASPFSWGSLRSFMAEMNCMEPEVNVDVDGTQANKHYDGDDDDTYPFPGTANKNDKASKKLVQGRLQQLSANNRKLVGTVQVQEADTFDREERGMATSGTDEVDGANEDEKDEEETPVNARELMPLLNLVEKVQSYVFAGKHDGLQLQSISQLLNRIETRIGKNDKEIADSPDIEKTTDEPSSETISNQVQRVTRRIVNLAEDFLDENVYQATGGNDNLTMSEWTWDDELTLEGTLSLNETLRDQNQSVSLPAISSFIPLGSHPSVVQPSTMKAVSTVDDDDSMVTYEFDALDNGTNVQSPTARNGEAIKPTKSASEDDAGVPAFVAGSRSRALLDEAEGTDDGPAQPEVEPLPVKTTPRSLERAHGRHEIPTMHIIGLASVNDNRAETKTEEKEEVTMPPRKIGTLPPRSTVPLRVAPGKENVGVENKNSRNGAKQDQSTVSSSPKWLSESASRHTERKYQPKADQTNEWLQNLYHTGKKHSDEMTRNGSSPTIPSQRSKSTRMTSAENFWTKGVPKSFTLEKGLDDNFSQMTGVDSFPALDSGSSQAVPAEKPVGDSSVDEYGSIQLQKVGSLMLTTTPSHESFETPEHNHAPEPQNDRPSPKPEVTTKRKPSWKLRFPRVSTGSVRESQKK